MAARLKERYQKEIAPAIAKEFGIKNPMAVPRVEKSNRQRQNTGYRGR